MPLSALTNLLKKSPAKARVPARQPATRAVPPAPVATPATAPSPLLLALTEALDSLKAENLVTIPLAGKSSLADWLIIATGTSSRHLASLADRVTDTLRAHRAPMLGREGTGETEWVCVDAGDLVIHLFLPDARQHYNLEKLWSFPAGA